MTNSGDQVALAVDNLGTAGIAIPKRFPRRPIAEPLTDAFYKTALGSGSIVPPSGESASVRRTDLMVGWCVVCLVACGLVGFATAYFWKG